MIPGMTSLAACARAALVAALLLAAWASGQSRASAQRGTSNLQRATPDASPPVQLIVPDLAQFESPNAVLIAGRVFPVGWSPGGLLAYVYEPPDEACGCYIFHLIVQDLATNRIVWQHRHESGEIREGDPDQLTSVQAVWRARGATLSARLRALGIVRRAEPTLRAFATSADGGLRVQIHTTTVGDDSPAGFAHITSYQVGLITAHGLKTIVRGGSIETPANAAKTATPGIGIGPLEVESPGYLQSPYRSRVAVLLQETWRGWEGRPHVATLVFVGADLGTAAR